jgi:hypothetical protein
MVEYGTVILWKYFAFDALFHCKIIKSCYFLVLLDLYKWAADYQIKKPRETHTEFCVSKELF